MNLLSQKAISLLENMDDERGKLFSFSTKVSNGKYINDFNNPRKIRYTINVLLGLKKASRCEEYSVAWDVEELIIKFIAERREEIDNYADLGLLLLLCADVDRSEAALLLKRISNLVESSKLLKSNLQDCSWLLWGVVEAVRQGYKSAEKIARKVFKIAHGYFLDRDTLIPRYSLIWFRKNMSSFGGIAYFLRSMYEYANYFNDQYVLTLFKESVRRIIDFQGPLGEWPWFIEVDNAKVLDWYPVYSVHQDSMAMLFLLPGLSSGIRECINSVKRSYSWLLGNNQIGVPLIREKPFFIHRSIRYRKQWEKLDRYSRALFNHVTRKQSHFAKIDKLEINAECRSYHLGWILFVWADEQRFSEFTNSSVFR